MRILVILFYCILQACNNDRIRSIELEDQIAEGQISKDTTYEGVIKFYDKTSGNLATQANYKNGTLEGVRTVYFPSGQKQIELSYRNGEPFGFTKVYNNKGNLETEQYFYYGLRVGSSIQYVDNAPKDYKFFSFDNEVLFQLDYDSIGKKRIGELQMCFFHFKKRQLELLDFELSQNKDEYFIYLISPPRYKFTYSLCRIDSTHKIIETLQTFDDKMMWETFFVDTSPRLDKTSFALKLSVEDQINNEGMTAFKKLQ